MVDPDKLMRGNFLQYGVDRVKVLTIAKKSIRVYNVTQDSYINTWVGINDFDYVTLTLNIVKELGFYYDTDTLVHLKDGANGIELAGWGSLFELRVFGVKYGEIKYVHELQNVLNIFSE